MTNITLSAPKELIEQARQNAIERGTTLNQEFRDWLAHRNSAEGAARLARYDTLMAKIGPFKTARKYNRDEMNER